MYTNLTNALSQKESVPATNEYWGNEARMYQSLYNGISQAATNIQGYNPLPMNGYADQMPMHPASFANGMTMQQPAPEMPHTFYQGSPFLDSFPMSAADISQGLSYAYRPNGWMRSATQDSGRNNNGPGRRSDKRRKRTAYTGSQLKHLEMQFRGSHFLTRERRMQLAEELGLTERQIKIWFQNRRMKWKKRNNSNTTETSGEANSDVIGEVCGDFKPDLDGKPYSDDGDEEREVFSTSETENGQFLVSQNIYQHPYNVKLPVHL